MNIEGNEILWSQKNMAITKKYGQFTVYQKQIQENPDSTAFQSWSQIEQSDELEDAIDAMLDDYYSNFDEAGYIYDILPESDICMYRQLIN